jgi:hypothetical protein
LGSRLGEDLSSISANKLFLAPDHWDLEILRRGLDNTKSTKQDILLFTNNKSKSNNKPSDSKDDFYTGKKGLSSNRNNLSNRKRSLGDNKNNIRGTLNSLDASFLDNSNLVDITNTTQSVSIVQAPTQPPTRTL